MRQRPRAGNKNRESTRGANTLLWDRHSSRVVSRGSMHLWAKDSLRRLQWTKPYLAGRVESAAGAAPLRSQYLFRSSAQQPVNSFLVEPSRNVGFFTAFHPLFALLFGYVFLRSEFPWLNVWENNYEQLQTRGMEFQQHATSWHNQGTYQLARDLGRTRLRMLGWSLDCYQTVHCVFASCSARFPRQG
jgi:hypothetical protein